MCYKITLPNNTTISRTVMKNMRYALLPILVGISNLSYGNDDKSFAMIQIPNIQEQLFTDNITTLTDKPIIYQDGSVFNSNTFDIDTSDDKNADKIEYVAINEKNDGDIPTNNAPSSDISNNNLSSINLDKLSNNILWSTDNLSKSTFIHKPIATLKNDYQNFYQPERLGRLGLAFAGVGLMANVGTADSTLDHKFHQWYQNNIRSERTDQFAKISKNFGEGKYLIPLSLAAVGSHYVLPDNRVSSIGGDTFRAYAVGAPVLLVSQRALGASRPTEQPAQGSKYKPLHDDNSVSGHAFMGAVPFLTLANHSDEPAVKYGAYLASILTAWSRVNDDKHYLSQAILGWYIAYESVNAVQQSNTQHRQNNHQLSPMVAGDKVGVIYHYWW